MLTSSLVQQQGPHPCDLFGLGKAVGADPAPRCLLLVAGVVCPPRAIQILKGRNSPHGV